MSTIPYNTEIPLGISLGNGSIFSLKATELSNFEAGTQIMLKDNVTSAIVDFDCWRSLYI